MSYWYRTGTVNFVNNENLVTGKGCLWASQVLAGDLMTLDGSKFYEVESVSSDLLINLKTPYLENSVTDSEYAIVRNFSGTLKSDIASKLSDLVLKYHITLDELCTWLSSPDDTVKLTGYDGKSLAVPTPSKLAKMIELVSSAAAAEWGAVYERDTKSAAATATESATFIAVALSGFRGNNIGSFPDEPTEQSLDRAFFENAEYFDTVARKIKIYTASRTWVDYSSAAQLASAVNSLNSECGFYGVSSKTLAAPMSSGTVTLLVDKQGAFVIGSRVRAINTPSNFFEGTISSIEANSFQIKADHSLGTEPASSWAITPAGVVGARGEQGISGDKGLRGDRGAVGPAGPRGAQGAQGDEGPSGEKGDTGSLGPQGPQGLLGPQGPQGLRGPTGGQGIPGPQGLQGQVITVDGGVVSGPRGDVGPEGPEGPIGPQGEPGVGEQGPQGVQGEPGPRGKQGIDSFTLLSEMITKYDDVNKVATGATTFEGAKEAALDTLIASLEGGGALEEIKSKAHNAVNDARSREIFAEELATSLNTYASPLEEIKRKADGAISGEDVATFTLDTLIKSFLKPTSTLYAMRAQCAAALPYSVARDVISQEVATFFNTDGNPLQVIRTKAYAATTPETVRIIFAQELANAFNTEGSPLQITRSKAYAAISGDSVKNILNAQLATSFNTPESPLAITRSKAYAAATPAMVRGIVAQELATSFNTTGTPLQVTRSKAYAAITPDKLTAALAVSVTTEGSPLNLIRKQLDALFLAMENGETPMIQRFYDTKAA